MHELITFMILLLPTCTAKTVSLITHENDSSRVCKLISISSSRDYLENEDRLIKTGAQTLPRSLSGTLISIQCQRHKKYGHQVKILPMIPPQPPPMGCFHSNPQMIASIVIGSLHSLPLNLKSHRLHLQEVPRTLMTPCIGLQFIKRAVLERTKEITHKRQ